MRLSGSLPQKREKIKQKTGKQLHMCYTETEKCDKIKKE
jgi:hypothetical protein